MKLENEVISRRDLIRGFLATSIAAALTLPTGVAKAFEGPGHLVDPDKWYLGATDLTEASLERMITQLMLNGQVITKTFMLPNGVLLRGII